MSKFFTDVSKVGGASPFEPKRQFRWVVQFGKHPDAEFMCKSVAKPSFDMDVEEHDFLNHKFKYPTRIAWEDISLTFIDAFEADMGSRFWDMLRFMGYKLPNRKFDAAVGITKANAVASLGEISILQLDGGGVQNEVEAGIPVYSPANIRETWTLKNAFIKSIKWGGDLSYENTGLVECELDLAYDWAEYSRSLTEKYGNF